MTFPGYLALTAAEFAGCETLPEQCAWMACHFSCYGTQLSNCPDSLPEGSMLIVNDRTPPAKHDPQRIIQQLTQLIEELKISCILMDFQRPDFPDNAQIAKALQDLPCPVGVSALYSENLSCSVFLPPVPLNMPLEEYLKPWKDREVWLEAALDCRLYTLTEQGCRQSALADIPKEHPHIFRDEKLYYHYCMEEEADKVHFSLWRNAEDLLALLLEAEKLGVKKAVGLYQELGKAFMNP
jgi:hypothetical protein